MKLVSLLIVPICLFWLGRSTLTETVTNEDRNHLVSSIQSAQDPQSKLFENSDTTTYFALDALSRVGKPAAKASELCKSLQKSKPSSWEDFHHLLVGRSILPNCLTQVEQKTKNKILSAVESNKLTNIYYAVDAATVLIQQGLASWDEFNWGAILKNLDSFKGKTGLYSESPNGKASVYRSALALLTVSNVLSAPQFASLSSDDIPADVASIINAIPASIDAMLSKRDSYDTVLSFSNSLTATTTVVESIYTLSNIISQSQWNVINDVSRFFDTETIEKLARFTLRFRSFAGCVGARNSLVLLDILENSQKFVATPPISIQFSNLVTDAGNPLTVEITDMFGRSVLSSDAVVTLKSSKEKQSKSSGPKAAPFVSTGPTVYTYDFYTGLQSKAEDHAISGTFDVVVDVTDTALSKPLTLKSAVKVAGSLNGLSVSVGPASKKEDGMVTVKYPQTVDTVMEASPAQKLKFDLKIDSYVKPRHVIFDFTQNGRSVLQLAPKRRTDKYSLMVDVNKKTFSRLGGGHFDVNVIVSDSLLAESRYWHSVVTVELIEEEDETEGDYEPVNDEVPTFAPKVVIHHTFGQSEDHSFSLTTVVFNVLVWVPFLLLVYDLFIRRGIELSFGGGLYSLLFVVFLVLNCVVLVLYWYQWNIFEAMFNLFIVSIPAVVFGYKVLKAHLLARVSTPKKKAE